MHKTVIFNNQVIEESQEMYSENNKGRVIRFVKDSLFVFGDSTNKLNFYWQRMDYRYKVYWDTLFNQPSITVFRNYIKPKNKVLNIADYKIVRINDNELVIDASSYSRVGYFKGLDINDVTFRYIYRRKGVSEMIEKLKGEWYSICMNHLDSTNLVFYRNKPDSLKENYNHYWMIENNGEFSCEYLSNCNSKDQLNNSVNIDLHVYDSKLVYSISGVVDGVYIKKKLNFNNYLGTFYIDNFENLESQPFYILSIDDEKMILNLKKP